MIATVAAHQVLSLRRRRVLNVLIGTLIGVTVLAGVLGWASHETIIGVYDESVRLLASRGLGAPPNPFLLKPVLSLLSNEIIYITMIGALVALVLGHLSVADDETTGIARLIFSRRMTRKHYALGKIVAVAYVLALGLAACMVVSVGALLLVNRKLPSLENMGRLIGFFVFSWLYLMVFALIGIVTLLVTRRRSLGLLTAIGTWLVVTFALPQFTSGLRPSQSLNPIVDRISTSQTFFRITSRGRPFSIAEQFKEAAGRILATSATESIAATARRVAPIVMLFAVLCLLTIRLVQRHDFSRSNSGE
jgi:ABC-type transport system involved in multi-copper enzyme maturation permease subunit